MFNFVFLLSLNIKVCFMTIKPLFRQIDSGGFGKSGVWLWYSKCPHSQGLKLTMVFKRTRQLGHTHTTAYAHSHKISLEQSKSIQKDERKEREVVPLERKRWGRGLMGKEGRRDGENSGKLGAVTGYQLYLDSEPEETRSGVCSSSDSGKKRLCSDCREKRKKKKMLGETMSNWWTAFFYHHDFDKQNYWKVIQVKLCSCPINLSTVNRIII